MIDLYVPPDVFEPGHDSSAHCGPCAVAALLGVTIQQVKASGTLLYKSMNLTEARGAVERFGRRLDKVKAPVTAGVAHVMWDDPWTTAGPRVAYRYSHWITYRKVGEALAFYDVNSGEAGGWSTLVEWERDVRPMLLPRRGTGWHINAYLELA